MSSKVNPKVTGDRLLSRKLKCTQILNYRRIYIQRVDLDRVEIFNTYNDQS